jgi:hypothetical protein
MVVAADRGQARTILRYIKGLLKTVPMLAQTIDGETQESVNLTNRIVIETHTSSYRAVRGYTVVAALLDEVAFWTTDEAGANPDFEVLNAIRPAMATVPNAMMLCASSPYARRGALWEAYHRNFGQSGGSLIWQAAMQTMNPTVPASYIANEYEKDAISASAEFGAQFRSDIEGFVSREAIEAVTDMGTLERGPFQARRYVAFVDPSGGSGDSFTLGIAHKEGDVGILDCLRETRPPFSPESVVAEYAHILKQYRVRRIQGDRYAGEWPREPFRKLGIVYDASAKPKSDLYRDCLALINSRRVRLLGDRRLLNQITSLERRTARGGRDSIDHPPGAHDDLANAALGCLLLATEKQRNARIGITLDGAGPITWEEEKVPLNIRTVTVPVAEMAEHGLRTQAEPLFKPFKRNAQ